MTAFTPGPFEMGQTCNLYRKVKRSTVTNGYEPVGPSFSGKIIEIHRKLECYWCEVEVTPV